METQNSRIITYPSVVEKQSDHTVVLIDAIDEDIERIGLFLAVCQQNFDVYLYQGETGDLEWLNHIGQSADTYLINEVSQVRISPDSIRYGIGQEYPNPLKYFEQIEQQVVDNTVETLL
jgi:hypothetical protein